MSNVVSCIFPKFIPMSVDTETSYLYRDKEEVYMIVQNVIVRRVRKIA
jgi:hypothetical protein